MNLKRPSTLVRAAVLGAALVVALAGCSSNDLLAQYQSGSNKNYISGDGSVTEVKVSDRTDPVQFTATTDEGKSISRKTYEGHVVVLNFWYASCPPCRVEAPALQSLSEQYSSDGVQFIGVNVRDESDTSRAFARNFKITYPSVTDVTDAKVQLALAGTRGPNSTPTTIVLDSKGRVAARILGEVDKSILNTLISDTVAGK
ncbi:thiol-disulfide isomerase/thioredoxin [Frondihabitans sp. PhB188]|uniref:TlpA family protein disulfide reductase n=1 Tax=Frondihabitans sp. PhB188 TaxID=2485200 RepID=UPI000F47B6C0|nr:TlpA disulfide reductase family protein [Frondihabitans sp. PhB188]ROQ39425.1 thiol-disulfide isomerase/thioredoxin [Frondihabitans sp. PhB188]